MKKRCPACDREFVGTLVVCPSDSTLLVPVKQTLIGQTLANRYEVLEEIGRGGMSIVYKGRHGVMDRFVAIKMLQSQLLSDQTSVKRFEREARAVASLSHPNVITVYDCDIHDGQPYLVMDYLIGESLSDIIRRDKRVRVDRVVKIFIRVCDALEHAHQKGVLHRDLKSSNIMLVDGSDGTKDIVKVVDFGIAKILPSSGKQAQNLTATGEIFGSPIYMSPEQCQGLPLDQRSDIYSTAVMMYEAVTGEPPLLGENIVDTMQMHVMSNPVGFAQIRPDLYFPPAVEAVVFKALEKNPDDRFQSMLEFKEALEYVEKTLSGEAEPDQSASQKGSAVRLPRQTRQGMTGSRPPSQMPKPSLESPDLRSSSARNSKIEQRNTSSRNAKIDPRLSSPRNAKVDTTQSSPRNLKIDQDLASFKVADLQELGARKERKKRLILIAVLVVALLFAIASVAFIVAKFTSH